MDRSPIAVLADLPLEWTYEKVHFSIFYRTTLWTMVKRSPASTTLVPVHVERTAGEPLHRQVYRELVQLILSGRLRPRARVPSSRMLADELGVARNTVLLDVDQLMSEGYVETRHGSGTYVSLELPDRSPLRLQGDEAKRGRRPVLAKRVPLLVASA